MKPAGVRDTWYVLVFILAVACNDQRAVSPSAVDKVKKAPAGVLAPVPIVTENDIMDTLKALPFVKKSNTHIDSVTHHKHAMAFIIDTAGKEYNVRAGFDGDERFETYYTFTVNKKTRAIKVLDVVMDEMISPEEFEKRSKATR